MTEINTHGLRINFGKHKGERVTRLPVDYLEWLINENTHYSDIARAELERRGVPLNGRKIEVSAHAVDRASLRVLNIWQAEHKPNEGLHAWLCRISIQAINQMGLEDAAPEFKIIYSDMVLAFKSGILYPTLVTVMKPNTPLDTVGKQ